MNITALRERPRQSLARPEIADFFNGWFENFWNRPSTLAENGEIVPPVNVAETDKNVIVSMELPGFDEKYVQIQMMGNQLTISGERKWEDEKKGKEFHRVESQYGFFSRLITLPENLRTDSPEAVFKRGVLTLTFTKVEATPATRIKIKMAD